MVNLKYSNNLVRKGDIFYVELGTEINGHVQNGGENGFRPCIIMANQTACKVSPVLLVVPITSSCKKLAKELPTHMNLGTLLEEPSVATFEQILTVNRYQLESKITRLPRKMMEIAYEKLKISLGIPFDSVV